MGPGGFFPTNPDLANILRRTDLDFKNFYFPHFLDPKFLDFQVPRFPKSGLGRAKLGLSHLNQQIGSASGPDSDLLGPIWGHPRHVFHGPKQIQKMSEFCIFSLVGQWALFTRFGGTEAKGDGRRDRRSM